MNKSNPDEKTEYWNLQCPHCKCYERVIFCSNPAMQRIKWPILHCRCGKYYTHLQSSRLKFLFTDKEKNPDKFWLDRAITIEANRIDESNCHSFPR